VKGVVLGFEGFAFGAVLLFEFLRSRSEVFDQLRAAGMEIRRGLMRHELGRAVLAEDVTI
jgi:hypothetical protein